MRSSASVHIDRPPAAVFPYIEEPAKLRLWVSGLAETVRLTPGETRVGTQFRNITQQPNGKRAEAQGEIIAFEQNQRIAYRVNDGGFLAVIEYSLAESAGHTLLTQTLTTTPQNPLLKLLFAFMGPMVSGQARKRLETDLAKLKQVVEGT
jgi:uncharacterized protein YndB with AHSA1/START domain